MEKEDRVERMMDVYCAGIEDPLEIVSLKEDLFYPLAALPEVVESVLKQNGTHRRFILKYLTKQELIEIEKSCTENIVLSRAVLGALSIAGRVDVELRNTIREKKIPIFSNPDHLSPWIRSRLLQAIADDIWQNIFDALLDYPQTKKLRIIFFGALFKDKKNEKMPENFKFAHREENSRSR